MKETSPGPYVEGSKISYDVTLVNSGTRKLWEAQIKQTHDFDYVSGERSLVESGSFMKVADTKTVKLEYTVTSDDASSKLVDLTAYAVVGGAIYHEKTLSIDLSPIQANDVTYSVKEGKLNSLLTFTSNDVSFTSVNTTPVTPPTNGTLIINPDGTFTYTPDDGFQGTDQFEYQISNDFASDTAIVTLKVDDDEDGITNDVDNDDDGDGIVDSEDKSIPDVVKVCGGKQNNYSIGGGSFGNFTGKLHPGNYGGKLTPTKLDIHKQIETLTKEYLDGAAIVFDGWIRDGGYSNEELKLLDDYIRSGGLVLSTNDASTYDPVANYYGLETGGTKEATEIWTFQDVDHPLLNGSHGLNVNLVGKTIKGAQWITGFIKGIQPTDQILAKDENGLATIISRKIGDGEIIFMGDEGPFRNTSYGGDYLPDDNEDVYSAALMTWAISRMSTDERLN